MNEAAPHMGFLDGLVNHAFGLEPILQPRKASLFEPQASSAAVEPFGESTADEFPAPAAALSPTYTPPPIDHPPERVPDTLHAAIETPPQPEPHAVRIATLVPDDVTPRVTPIGQRPTTPVLSPLAPLPHIVSKTEPFAHREEISRRTDHVVERSVENIRNVVRAADEPLPRRHNEARTGFTAEPVKTRHEDVAPANAALIAQPVAQDLVAPPAEASGRRTPVTTVLESRAPEGRIVNVTIGRVEVRAHSTPNRANTGQRGTKAMSLDDYLKRRGGA